MKRAILAMMFCAIAGEAQAQGIPVIDFSSILQAIKSYTLQAEQLRTENQSYATQVQQFATEAQQLAAFVHNPSLGAAMGLLNQAGLGNSLPMNPTAAMSLVNGFGSRGGIPGILGQIGQLNGLIGTSYTAHHVYTPTDNSWASQQLIANGNAVAGFQGASLAAYGDLRTHQEALQPLRDRLATATTPKDVADAQAQIALEQAWTENQQGQIAAIAAARQAERDQRAQRDDESLGLAIDNWLQQAKAEGRGL